jgi:two-component system, sensor histidine kinase
MLEKVEILFIEDSETDFLLACQLFNHSKMSITRAATLAAGIEKLRTQQFDLILLDLAVPDSFGMTTLHKISSLVEQHPPIVVFTGSDDEASVIEALQNGAQDYLVKGGTDKETLERAIRYSIERHRVDRELRRTNEELVQLNRQLSLSRDEAIKANELKTQFVANISHEIRTPMSGILGLAELLADELEGQNREVADLIFQSAKNLMTLVNDLLDLAKVEAGRVEITNEQFQIRKLAKDVSAVFQHAAASKQIKLVSKVDDAVAVEGYGDSHRIRQVLQNLVQNAIKFTESGSVELHIESTMRAGRNNVRFSVRDTGKGISTEDQKKLFQLFVQVDGSTKRRHSGTGLGLALSKRLVELMGGEIGVESEVGKGTTFWVELPLEVGTPSSSLS